MNKKLAFLTMDSLEEFECYDTLTIPPLEALGWSVDLISWRAQDVDWNQYRAVIIRSPWDYQDDAEAFSNVLSTIEASSAELLNSKATCDWNINKRYLKELEDKGVQIVPTIWPENIDEQTLIEAFEEFNADAIVVKPYVSANADNTFWLKKESFHDALPELQETFASRDAMVQPFMQSIVEEGEFSLFFFGDEYSHTILKTPKDDDFRVQEEHGGRLKTLEPEAKLLEQAREIMEKVNPKVLYGRVDLVRHGDAFALMELELIEPSLYFNMDPESPARFAKVVDAWLG